MDVETSIDFTALFTSRYYILTSHRTGIKLIVIATQSAIMQHDCCNQSRGHLQYFLQRNYDCGIIKFFSIAMRNDHFAQIINRFLYIHTHLYDCVFKLFLWISNCKKYVAKAHQCICRVCVRIHKIILICIFSSLNRF